MLKDKLSISVIIPCFDVGPLVVEAVDSVLNQQLGAGLRLSDIEVLVIDDFSTDTATLAALDVLQERSPIVRVLRNDRTKGVAGARNHGIKFARGEWLAFLDADDIWLPDALQKRWRFILDSPSLAWIGGDYALWYPGGHLVASGNENTEHARGRMLSPAFATGRPIKFVRPVKEFIAAQIVLPCSVMAKKELFNQVGGFDESLHKGEDYEMCFRMALVADFYFMPHCIFHYRQRQGSLTKIGGPPTQWEIIFFRRMLRNPFFGEHVRDIRKKLSSLSLANTYYYRSKGQWINSIKAATATVRWQPFVAIGWRQIFAALIRR